jgi:hypothetical protein
VVNAYQPFTRSSTAMDRVTAPEKKGSRHNPQHDGWSICGFIPSFSSELAIEAVGVKPSSVDIRLLSLLGSYHEHAIGKFNTCSRGLTHRSLTDTGGGYNLEGTSFPHSTPWPSQPTVSPFHLRAPPGLQFIQVLTTKPEFEFKGTYGCYVVFRPLSHLLWPTTTPSHS